MNKIVILENIENWNPKSYPDSTIITVSQLWYEKLNKQSVNIKTVMDYIHIDEINEIGMQNNHRVHQFLKEIDELLIASEIDEKYLLENFYYYYLKIFIDTVIVYQTIANNIITQEAPIKVTCVIDTSKDVVDESLFFYNSSNLLSQLIVGECRSRGIPCNIVVSSRFQISITIPRVKDLIKIFLLKLSIFQLGKKAYILILDLAHDVSILKTILENSGYNIIIAKYIKGKSVLVCKNRPVKLLLDYIAKQDLKRHKNIVSVIYKNNQTRIISKYFEIENSKACPINTRLSLFFKSIIPKYWEELLLASKLFLETDIKLAISASSNLPTGGQAMGKVALRNGVFTCYQEGGAYGYSEWPMHQNTDYLNCNNFLAYGNGITNIVAKNSDLKIFPVGSLSLGKFKQRDTLISDNTDIRKTLLLLLNISGDEAYVQHYPYNGGPPCHINHFQFKLIDYFACQTEYRIIIKLKKFTSQYNIYKEYIELKRYHNITISYDVLSEIIGKVDYIVLDYPSTVLLEVLVANKPFVIYCYPGAYQFLEEIGEYVKCGAIPVVSSADAILSNLKNWEIGSKMREKFKFLYCQLADENNVIETIQKIAYDKS